MNEVYQDEEVRKECTITTSNDCGCFSVKVNGGSFWITPDMKEGLNKIVRVFRDSGYAVTIKNKGL